MNKRLEMRVALVVMALAVLVSIPFDFVCATYTWSYPDFFVTTSDVRVGDMQLWPSLSQLRIDLIHAALFSLVAIAGLVACRRLGDRIEFVVAFLACAACLYVVVSRQPGIAVGVDTLLSEARHAIVAGYPLACFVLSRLIHRHVGEPAAIALGVAAHVASVVFCTWEGSGYALSVSIPTIVWMALCWTLFAVPEHLVGWLQTLGARRKVALATLSVLVQTFVLSLWRLAEIARSLVLPSHPQPGWFNSNWLTTHADALAALPTSSYRDLVADPAMLDGLQAIPLAWLGVTCGAAYRMAYAAILAVFLTAVFVIWRDARRSGRRREVEVLALGVMLSNLWGAVCSVLTLTSTGTVTLVSGNPFQLVPIACLLAAGFLCTRADGADLAPWDPTDSPRVARLS